MPAAVLPTPPQTIAFSPALASPAPTPTIAPVMVWVVDTGTPR